VLLVRSFLNQKLNPLGPGAIALSVIEVQMTAKKANVTSYLRSKVSFSESMKSHS